MTIVIDAVNAVGWGWSSSHVGEEIWETPLPSFANSYSAATVVLPRLMFYGIAPDAHRNPDAVFRQPRTAVSKCGMVVAALPVPAPLGMPC